MIMTTPNIRLLPACLVAALLLLSFAPAEARIRLNKETITSGEAVEILLDSAATQVTITYRPNSRLARTDTLRSEAGDIRFPWTPKRAGVVSISANGASKNISVRYNGLSVSGLIVMLVAFGMLFGGAAFSLRLLFKDQEEDGTLDLDPGRLPDT
jgi:hypothetical protein